MWSLRSRGEWDRKRSYLIKNLFENIPTLRTILEENESSSPLDCNFEDKSPLPELTIEVEPKKPNYDDDSEYMYDNLAVEIRHLYRKEFLDGNSTSSLEYSSYSASSTYTNVLEDTYHDYDVTEHDIGFLKETDLSNSEISSVSTLIESETFTVQVEVHSQVHENQEDLACEQLGFMNSKQFILQSEEDTMDVSSTEIESTEIEADASGYYGNLESSVSFSPASPEILRQRKRFTWFGTPTDFLLSKSSSTISRSIHMSIDVDSEFYEEINTSDQETEIVQISSDNETVMTPNPTRKKKSDIFLIEMRHTKSLASYSSSSSFKIVKSVSVQTSFSDSKTDDTCYWSKLFGESFTVYDICSCSDHVC